MGNSCVVYMWLLLLTLHSVLHMVMPESTDEELLHGAPQLAIQEVWAVADAITVSLVTQNVTNQEVVVSIEKENDRSVTVLDFISDPDQGSAVDKNTSFVLHKIHTIEELSADTKYEVCVSLNEPQDKATNAVKSECIMVKTFPKVDQITGLYAALAATAIFITLGVSWLFYKTIFARFFSKHDKYTVDRVTNMQPVEIAVQDVPNS